MSVERIPLLVLYSFYRVSGEGLFKKSQFRNSEGACVLPWRPRVLRPCDMEYVMLHLIFSLPHA